MTEVTALSTNNAASVRDRITQLRHYIDERIIDQEALTLRLLIALLADGHLLVEGAPGLAKTTAIKTLAQGIEGEFHRIQFTPDLLPADLTGTEIYRPQDGSFHFQRGPIFHNLVLADEINRAPAKVQSALLEAMAERQVSIGRQTYPLPRLFLVMATQNPIEQEGTYPLPEAQLDRFLMHVRVGYPGAAGEQKILHLVREQARNEHSVQQAAANAPQGHAGNAVHGAPRNPRSAHVAGAGRLSHRNRHLHARPFALRRATCALGTIRRQPARDAGPGPLRARSRLAA